MLVSGIGTVAARSLSFLPLGSHMRNEADFFPAPLKAMNGSDVSERLILRLFFIWLLVATKLRDNLRLRPPCRFQETQG